MYNNQGSLQPLRGLNFLGTGFLPQGGSPRLTEEPAQKTFTYGCNLNETWLIIHNKGMQVGPSNKKGSSQKLLWLFKGESNGI